MTTKAKKKERKERRYTSFRETENKRDVGAGMRVLNLPDGVTMWRQKKGSVKLDIIPYEVGEGNPFAEEGSVHWERTFYTHRANDETHVCLRKTFGEECPICEYRSELGKDPDADEDLIKDLAPKQRQVFNIIVHDERDKGIQLWETSFYAFGKQLREKIENADEDDSYDTFFLAEDGLTLRVGFVEEKTGGFTFIKASDIEFRPRKTQYEDSIIDEATCLDAIIKKPEYDKVKASFLQTTDDDEKDDDEAEEKPKKGRGKSGGSKPDAKKKGKPSSATTRKPFCNDDDEDDDDEEATAEEAGLEMGDKVEHEDFGICTIVHISSDGTSLRIKDEDGEIHRAISPNELTKNEAEEKPKKGKSKASSSGAGAGGTGKGKKSALDQTDDDDDDDNNDDDDDDEDGDDDDDDDEEEEDDDDDDDDIPFDDDDEEPKPKKSRLSKGKK